MRKFKPRPTEKQVKKSFEALSVMSGQSESEIQTALFKWAKVFGRKYPELELLYHVPQRWTA